MLADLEGVVAQWCNPLALQQEQSGGQGSIPGSAPPHEHHDKGPQTRLALYYFCDPAVLVANTHNFTFTFINSAKIPYMLKTNSNVLQF